MCVPWCNSTSKVGCIIDILTFINIFKINFNQCAQTQPPSLAQSNANDRLAKSRGEIKQSRGKQKWENKEGKSQTKNKGGGLDGWVMP